MLKEIEIKDFIEEYGKFVFNTNEFSYPVTILGGDSTNQFPTIEVGAYIGIIYKENTFYVYQRVLEETSQLKWKIKKIKTCSTLLDAAKFLIFKLVEVKSEEFTENDKKRTCSKIFQKVS